MHLEMAEVIANNRCCYRQATLPRSHQMALLNKGNLGDAHSTQSYQFFFQRNNRRINRNNNQELPDEQEAALRINLEENTVVQNR